MTCSQSFTNIWFGSLAAPRHRISLMAASGGKAVVRRPDFSSLRLNVRFSRKRSFKTLQNRCFQGPLSARSAHRSSLFRATYYIVEYIGEATDIVRWLGFGQELLKRYRVGITSVWPPYALNTGAVIVLAN